MPTNEEVYNSIKSILKETLMCDDDEVSEGATLVGDLGAESIDFLDIVFNLEQNFSIEIDRSELFPEDILTNLLSWNGEDFEELIRSDMVYFETQNTGAVFSVGSITFCGSLPVNDGDNNISRLVKNVLNRFLEQ